MRLNSSELKLMHRFKENINVANRSLTDAQAAMGRAFLDGQAAQTAMNNFLAHVSEVYNLKPQDAIDAEGNIHLIDPGWAQEVPAKEGTVEG